MTAKAYLMQYRICVDDIKMKREELKKLKEDATAVSAALDGGAPTAGNVSDKVGVKSADIVDLEREIEEEMLTMRELRRDIRSSIANVSSPELRRVLTYRYICGCTFERVSVKMGRSYYHVVHRLHPRALKIIGETKKF